MAPCARRINLEIARGETMVLLGGSGSGRSISCGKLSGWEAGVGQDSRNGVDFARCRPRNSRKPGVRLAWRFKMRRS